MFPRRVTDTDRAVERRHSICPRCTEPRRANPLYVTEGHGARVIGYQCAVCERVWRVSNKPELVPRPTAPG